MASPARRGSPTSGRAPPHAAVLCSVRRRRVSCSPTSPRRCACWPSTARMRSIAAPSPTSIAAASWLDEDDLGDHRSEWVEPLRHDYRGVEVCELPPNGQGAAALVGARALRRPRAGPPFSDRGDEARARRRLRPFRGRAPPRCASRPRPARRAALARRPSARARPDAVDAPARRDDVPLRGRRRRHGDLADPERLRDVRLRDRRARDRRRPSESRRPDSSRRRATRTAWRPVGARSTRSSRACCSRAATCSARSA